MPDTASVVQDQVLDSIKTLEGATLEVIKGWTKTMSTMPSVTDFYTAPKMETFTAFAEKLWATQKEFLVSLMEVATEAGKTVPETIKRTAAAATPKQ